MSGTRRPMRWLLPLGAVLLCMGAVWLFSAQSGTLSSGLSRGVLGLIETELPGFYALLRRKFSPAVSALLAVMLAAGFALTDEWHQLSVPGRDGNLRDVLIDTAGAFTGAVLGCVLTGLRRLLARLRGRKPAA